MDAIPAAKRSTTFTADRKKLTDAKAKLETDNAKGLAELKKG